MKANTITGVDTRPTMTLSLLVLVALAAFSGVADARGCGMMKPPSYMGTPPGPMHHPMHGRMHHRGGYAPGAKYGQSVVAVAKRAGEFSTLISAVEAAGLTALLEGEGPITLFAPTDAAFKELPEGTLESLLADKEKLIAVLKYHLVAGRLTSTDVLTSRTLKTAADQDLATADLSVTRADVRAGNGVIHVVDKVLLPSG
jgi:hypothetical protein